jgi:hypothetical protein
MKQFTEEELKKELDKAFRVGQSTGLANGIVERIRMQKRISAQKRELRRLNKQIERLYVGAAAQRRYEANPFEFDTGE